MPRVSDSGPSHRLSWIATGVCIVLACATFAIAEQAADGDAKVKPSSNTPQGATAVNKDSEHPSPAKSTASNEDASSDSAVASKTRVQTATFAVG